MKQNKVVHEILAIKLEVVLSKQNCFAYMIEAQSCLLALEQGFLFLRGTKLS